MNSAIPLDAVIMPFLGWLLRTSAGAAAVAGLVLLVQFLFARWLTPAWRYRLWGLVVLRLLLPIVPPSATSVWNVERWAPATQAMFQTVGERSNLRPAAVSGSDALPSNRTASAGVVVKYGPVPRRLPTSERPVQSARDLREGRASALPALVMAIWLAVAACLLARLVASNVILIRRLRRATPVTDPHVLAHFECCCREAGVSRRPILCVSDVVRVPAAAGLWRPRILLPPGMLAQLSPEEMRAIVLHELAHVRCHDVAINGLVALLQAVHWFNPILWLAFTRLRTDREAVRDAMVLRLMAGAEPADAADAYGRTLLKITEWLAPRSERAGFVAGVAGLFGPRAVVLPSLFGHRSGLQRRLQMIGRYPLGARRGSLLGPALAIVLAAAALTRATDPPAAEPRPSPASAPAAPAMPPAKPQAPEQNVPLEQAVPPELQRKLDRILPELSFDTVLLDDIVDFLRDVSGAKIVVNWKALKAAGINQSTMVTVRLKNVRFSKALSIILDAASGGHKPRLGYRVEDGVIVISSIDDLSKNVEVRVYDVRDLVVDIPSFEDAPQLGKPQIRGATVPATTQPATREGRNAHDEAVKQLVQTIESTVAPDTWKDRGGSVAALRELEGQLIVTQAPENHAQIVRLLDQLRESRSLQCEVDARFVCCDEAVSKALLAKWQKLAAPATLPADAGAKEPRGSGMVAFLLDDAQRGEFLRTSQNKPGASVTAAPKIVLFNGQRAYVMVATSTSYVSAYAANNTADGRTRYDPVTAVVQYGTVLDVQATINADRTAATLFLHPQLAALFGMKSVPWPGRPAGSNLTVQEPQIRTAEVSTTVNVPVGRTLVLGGLSDPRVTGAPGAETRPGQPQKSLFLLVKPKLILGPPAPTTSAPLKTSRLRVPQP
ncbi:MAG TPA: M56 family metallopeptidase [Tepidisphaeraceae bacterium]|jgi:beta-lactamase regulating signal transducer with metallopeptidase domain